MEEVTRIQRHREEGGDVYIEKARKNVEKGESLVSPWVTDVAVVLKF